MLDDFVKAWLPARLNTRVGQGALARWPSCRLFPANYGVKSLQGTSMHKVTFRFYEELNDYLPEKVRKVDFIHSFTHPISIQHAITSLHVPCEEVDLILVNGLPVNFSYVFKDNDRVSVYPIFETFDISGVTHVRDKTLKEMRKQQEDLR